MTSALVTDMCVYFGNTAGVFYALDRVTGEELWKVDMRAEGFPGHHCINVFNASAILVDGKVIVGGGGYEHPYPLDPKPDPRIIALPSIIGGIQTGCATDGKSIFTNGIDWLLLNSKKPGMPEGGRVVSVLGNLAKENWRHERPKLDLPIYKGGVPVGAGIALGGGLVCFTPTVTEQLVMLDAESGKMLKEIPIGTVWSGPSISRGRVYVGTGSILFLKQQATGILYSFGLPGDDEIARMGAGNE